MQNELPSALGDCVLVSLLSVVVEGQAELARAPVGSILTLRIQKLWLRSGSCMTYAGVGLV